MKTPSYHAVGAVPVLSGGATKLFQTHLAVTETCLSNRWTGLTRSPEIVFLTSEHL